MQGLYPGIISEKKRKYQEAWEKGSISHDDEARPMRIEVHVRCGDYYHVRSGMDFRCAGGRVPEPGLPKFSMHT
jgi:hypothetical protein